MGDQTTIDWAKATRIALVVPGDSQVDDEFWRLLAPHGIPLVSRTTGAQHEHMATVGAAAAHTKSLAESSDLEVAADRLRAVKAQAAAYPVRQYAVPGAIWTSPSASKASLVFRPYPPQRRWCMLVRP